MHFRNVFLALGAVITAASCSCTRERDAPEAFTPNRKSGSELVIAPQEFQIRNGVAIGEEGETVVEIESFPLEFAFTRDGEQSGTWVGEHSNSCVEYRISIKTRTRIDNRLVNLEAIALIHATVSDGSEWDRHLRLELRDIPASKFVDVEGKDVAVTAVSSQLNTIIGRQFNSADNARFAAAIAESGQFVIWDADFEGVEIKLIARKLNQAEQ